MFDHPICVSEHLWKQISLPTPENANITLCTFTHTSISESDVPFGFVVVECDVNIPPAWEVALSIYSSHSVYGKLFIINRKTE